MPVLPGIGVITLDTALRIRSWNDWLVAATGVPEALACGRVVTDFVPAARAETIGDELTEVLSRGTTRVLAAAFHQSLFLCPPPYPNAHFQEMQQRVTFAPLRDDVRIVGVIITLEDVTARMIGERECAQHAADGLPETEGRVAQAGADDWQRRAEATRALTQHATDAEMAQLLEALERDHNNYSVLSGALQVLVAAQRDVTAPLVRLLHNANANVRMHAALALGALGDPAGVAGLLGALDDDDGNVRFHAIEALGRLGAPEAVAGLQRVAESGDFFLAFPAIDALGRIDDAAVVPALMTLVDHDDLRPAVVDALAALGDEDCVGVLVDLLNDGRSGVPPIAMALVRIAQRYDDTFGAAAFIVDATRAALRPAGVARLVAAATADGTLSPSVATLLGWVGEEGLGALVSVVGRHDVRAEVEDAILRIGAPAVPLLTTQLESGTREARVTSARLLGALGRPEAGDALIEALGSHDNELVATAATALAALGVQAAMDGLIALFAHPDVMVRQAAMAAVHALPLETSQSKLVALLDNADPRVRECAVRSCGYFAFDGGIAGIVRAAADESEDVRRAAIEQLPLVDEARGAETLRAALTRETPRNRAAAAHALRLVDGDRVDAALIEALSDDHAWVRYFAAGSLAHRGTAVAVGTLEAMALGDTAPHVRIAAIRALAVLGVPELLRVAPMAFDDPDEDIAAAAILALTAGGRQPGVEPLLDRAVQSPRGALRVAAAEALGSVGTPASVQTLAWAARLSDPVSLSDTAMDSLRRAAFLADGAPSAIAALLQLGLDSGRRERVVQLLSTLSPEAVPVLARELGSVRPPIRVMVVDALARMRSAAATEHVSMALSDPDASVRASAVNAFGRLGSSGISHALVAMSLDDPDASVRRRALAVCHRYDWVPARQDTAER